AHALPKDTAGSVTGCGCGAQAALSRVTVASCASLFLSNTVTVGLASSHVTSTGCSPPAATLTSWSASLPAGLMTNSASSVPASSVTEAESHVAVMEADGSTVTGGGLLSAGPVQANQWLIVGTFLGGLPTNGA